MRGRGGGGEEEGEGEGEGEEKKEKKYSKASHGLVPNLHQLTLLLPACLALSQLLQHGRLPPATGPLPMLYSLPGIPPSPLLLLTPHS